jgi:hypothetical protein
VGFFNRFQRSPRLSGFSPASPAERFQSFYLWLRNASNVPAEFAPKCRRIIKQLTHFSMGSAGFLRCGLFGAEFVWLWWQGEVPVTRQADAQMRVRRDNKPSLRLRP